MNTQPLFPLPYDGSAQHQESWSKAKAFEGKQVTVTLANGSTIRGKVHRAEVGYAGETHRSPHAVGFTLIDACGYSQWAPGSLQAIEIDEA